MAEIIFKKGNTPVARLDITHPDADENLSLEEKGTAKIIRLSDNQEITREELSKIADNFDSKVNGTSENLLIAKFLKSVDKFLGDEQFRHFRQSVFEIPLAEIKKEVNKQSAQTRHLHPLYPLVSNGSDKIWIPVDLAGKWESLSDADLKKIWDDETVNEDVKKALRHLATTSHKATLKFGYTTLDLGAFLQRVSQDDADPAPTPEAESVSPGEGGGGPPAKGLMASLLPGVDLANLDQSTLGALAQVRLLRRKIMEIIALLRALIGGADDTMITTLAELQAVIERIGASETALLASDKTQKLTEILDKLRNKQLEYQEEFRKAEGEVAKDFKNQSARDRMARFEKLANQVNALIPLVEAMKRPLQVMTEQRQEAAQTAEYLARQMRGNNRSADRGRFTS